MNNNFKEYLNTQLSGIRKAGLYKEESAIETAQAVRIRMDGGREVLNFCANNYLGLAQNSVVRAAAIEGLKEWGYGLASVRFICGTQTLHKRLEQKLSTFLETEDTILYSSCFDANTGLFETLLGPEDAIFSDELNHASIIDGVRLCKAQRFRYRNRNLEDLENQLKSAENTRFRLIATDGVFSMDGYVANLKGICDLAEKYDCLVMVDDSHATGFVGEKGKGTREYHGVEDRVDIVTGTLGKALGGASGGFTSGRKEIVEVLRQRSRPYLFSNTLAPSIASGTLAVLDILSESTELRDQLMRNTAFFRAKLEEAGFSVLPGWHPIVPIMIDDATLAVAFAQRMRECGVHVVAFTYPVVPQGKARIRVQISAAHTQGDLDFAVARFVEIKMEIGL
tara:strand:- start:375 stop:1559 length:1185 start_codon:yes stop_codon:yes gene_type:complete